MTDNIDLQEAIVKAKDSVDRSEKSINKNSHDNHSKNKISITIISAFVISIVLLFLFNDTLDKEIQRDLQVAATDLIMEADGSIYNYYKENNSLPEQLPLFSLRSIVQYRKVSEYTYELKLFYEGYDNPILVDIRETLSISNLDKQLNNPSE